jgi:hypothetical protein
VQLNEDYRRPATHTLVPVTPLSSSLLTSPTRFADVDWAHVPDVAGAYVIYEGGEVLYVGMAGRDGQGSLRRRRSCEFRPHPRAIERASSATAAVRAILAAPDAPDVLPSHRRELLSLCLWKITEAEGGKYGTRFRSRAALSAPRAELAHEHVYERQKLVDALLAAPADDDAVVARAVGCVVTRREHARLTAVSRARPELDGWERYEAAGVKVVDLLADVDAPAS